MAQDMNYDMATKTMNIGIVFKHNHGYDCLPSRSNNKGKIFKFYMKNLLINYQKVVRGKM